MSRDVPVWLAPHRAQVDAAVGRLKGTAVLIVRRLPRANRLQDELEPNGLTIGLQALALEQIEESLRRDVETARRGLPPGQIAIVCRDLDGRGQVYQVDAP